MRTRTKRLVMDAAVAVVVAVVLLLIPVYPTYVVKTTTTSSGRQEQMQLPDETSTLFEVLQRWTPHFASASMLEDPIVHSHPLKILAYYAAAWLAALGLGHGAACLVFRRRSDVAAPTPGSAPQNAGH